MNIINIYNIPTAVFCLSHLKVLSFQHTTDLSIPPEIIRLAPTLTSFSMITNTKSVVLPPELFEMHFLSSLMIVNCGVETLSEDIVKLTHLTELVLEQNQLLTLPSTLNRMLSLTTLSVKDNPRLTSLDALIGSTTITILRGANCLIDHLPTNIPNLHTIELGGNQLTSLEGLETLTSLSCILLEFGNNRITSIPYNALTKVQTILYLDLAGNKLTTLPDSVYRINDLTTINLRNNSFDEKEKEWIQGRFRLTNTNVLI